MLRGNYLRRPIFPHHDNGMIGRERQRFANAERLEPQVSDATRLGALHRGMVASAPARTDIPLALAAKIDKGPRRKIEPVQGHDRLRRRDHQRGGRRKPRRDRDRTRRHDIHAAERKALRELKTQNRRLHVI